MLHTLALGSAVLALASTFWFLFTNVFQRELRSIPGPWLAKFSNLSRFVDACSGQHPTTSLRLHQKYGPIVRIGPNVVSVADPKSIQAVLGLKANLDRTDSVRSMQNTCKGESMPMLISAMDSKTHARIKRPIGSSYSVSAMLEFEDAADRCISKLMSQLEKYSDGGKCNIEKWMACLTFDFILQATFSDDWGLLTSGKDIDNMLYMQRVQFTYISTMGQMPWLDYLLLKNPLLLMCLKIPNPLVDFVSKQVEHRLRGDENDAPAKRDFLAHFIEAQKQQPKIVTNIQLVTYAATNVLAASDTTSATLHINIYHILKYPRVYALIQAEIDDANPPFPVSYAVASTLPYLVATIKEVLRFFPTTGIELERKVGPEGLVLPSGARLAADTIVGINPWPVHRHRSVFGEDADDFIPERWLPQEGESAEDCEDRIRAMQRVILTFGAGPRACIGKHIAYLQLYKVIATLFGKFDVSVRREYLSRSY